MDLSSSIGKRQSIGLTAGEECDIAFQLVLDRCLKTLIDAYKKQILAQKDVSTSLLEHNVMPQDT